MPKRKIRMSGSIRLYDENFKSCVILSNWSHVYAELDMKGFFYWKNKEPENTVKVADIYKQMVTGFDCESLPSCPVPPLDGCVRDMFAFPNVRGDGSYIFFLCYASRNFSLWMESFFSHFPRASDLKRGCNNNDVNHNHTQPQNSFAPQPPPSSSVAASTASSSQFRLHYLDFNSDDDTNDNSTSRFPAHQQRHQQQYQHQQKLSIGTSKPGQQNRKRQHETPHSRSSDLSTRRSSTQKNPTKKQKKQTNQDGQVIFLKVGTYNVASLENWQKSIPALMNERRFDFCCLQRIKMSHHLSTNIGAGNKLFWTGRSNEGVAIIVSEKYARKVQDVVKIYDQIIHLKIRTDKQHLLNVLSVYAPEKERFLDEKEDFYGQLKDLIVNIDDSELVVICGDFNGQVGGNRGNDRGAHIGRTVGEQTFEGALLWKFASEMKLSLTNICSKKKFESLVTNNVGRDGLVFDYILVPEKDKRWLKNSFTSKVENDYQHRMVVAILRIDVGLRDNRIKFGRSDDQRMEKNGQCEDYFFD